MASWFRWAVFLTVMAVPARAAESLPAESYAIPAFDSPSLSPDGKYIANLEPENGRFVVAVRKAVALDEKPAVFAVNDWIVTRVRWVSNDRLVILLRRGERFEKLGGRLYTVGRTLSVSPDFKESAILMHDQTTLEDNSLANVTELIANDPDHVIAPLYVHDMKSRDRFRLDLLKVNVRTGKSQSVYAGHPSTKWWLTDGLGKAVVRLDMTTRPLRDHLMRYENGAWQNLATFDVSGDAESGIQGLSADGTSLVQLWNNDRGFKSVYAINLENADARKLIYANPHYDVFATIKDEWSGRVIGARYAHDKVESIYFDPERQAIQQELNRAFPEATARIVSESRDGSRMIVMAQGPRLPFSYYFFDKTTRKLSFIASNHPALKREHLGDMKPYSYTARDGLKIQAYLTLPPQGASKNLPVVVIPHGGPDSRIVLGFDWITQFLASRGYAVLHPNFRGSGGYGRKFTEAGLMQWGRKIQNDVTDGVKKLIEDGIADPKRVCIAGASFGGYVALAGATLTPELYACAISIAGMSELTEMLRTEARDFGRNSENLSFWYSRMGTIENNRLLLRKVSPARQVDDVKAPILLLHGEEDTAVRIDQSELMFDALKSAGKNVEFVRLENEDHFLGLMESRVRMLKEVERFLAEHTGSGQQSPAQRQVE